MKMLVFYSVVLNQHQAPVSDELWKLTNHSFVFVELTKQNENKGGTEDYSSRTYLLRAWESPDAYEKAMALARTAECCVFAGIESLQFEKERMKLGLLSFEMGERWLKHGLKSLASPRLLKWLLAYHLGRWNKKPLFKLCCSAFCAKDHKNLKSFDNKCYKWGYFTKVDDGGFKELVAEHVDVQEGSNGPGVVSLCSISRFETSGVAYSFS